MMKFALTGQQIMHSKSPALFAAAYHNHRRYSYELLPATTIGQAMSLFHSLSLLGMNVTAPYKQKVLVYLDKFSKEVEQVGAANVVLRQGGQLVAYNTDVVGVTDAFIQNGVAIQGKTALVLGAGGAGQAATYALKKGGARVFWANRSIAGIKTVAKHYKVDCLPLDDVSKHLAEVNLVVNTLPVMAPALENLPLNETHVVLDADYKHNPLAKLSAERHARYISGLSWLLWQAVPAFFYFTGVMPDVPAMKRVLFPSNDFPL
ncbi:MAG: hypothetical protein LBF90_06270 [Prevotellaceae bacterium]|jgi:shikimate dehydrogenase|nr:hypothetical protein [Prevotellaceae bacterium]